jgi:hypothetical protein
MSNPPTPGPSPTTLTAANKDMLSIREELFSDTSFPALGFSGSPVSEKAPSRQLGE